MSAIFMFLMSRRPTRSKLPVQLVRETVVRPLAAGDLQKLKVVDEVVKEPHGGSHRDPKQAMADLGDVLDRDLRDLAGQEPGSLREARGRKFIEMGSVGL